jgi:hypothetical protein
MIVCEKCHEELPDNNSAWMTPGGAIVCYSCIWDEQKETELILHKEVAREKRERERKAKV